MSSLLRWMKGGHLVMKAAVILRIFGHLTRAAIVSEFPSTPKTMMMIVTTPENWRNAVDELPTTMARCKKIEIIFDKISNKN